MSINHEEKPPFPFTYFKDVLRRRRFRVSLQVIGMCLKAASRRYDDWACSHIGLTLEDALVLAKEGDRIVHHLGDVEEPEDRVFGTPKHLQSDACAEHDSNYWHEMCDRYHNIWFRKAEEYAE